MKSSSKVLKKSPSNIFSNGFSPIDSIRAIAISLSISMSYPISFSSGKPPAPLGRYIPCILRSMCETKSSEYTDTTGTCLSVHSSRTPIVYQLLRHQLSCLETQWKKGYYYYTWSTSQRLNHRGLLCTHWVWLQERAAWYLMEWSHRNYSARTQSRKLQSQTPRLMDCKENKVLGTCPLKDCSVLMSDDYGGSTKYSGWSLLITISRQARGTK